MTPPLEVEDFPPLTEPEIEAVVDHCRSKAKKTPGPDEIPNSVWSIVHRANPGWLTTVFNADLSEGVFPARWKMAQLVLLPKPGKPVGELSSNWPLCLLNTAKKMLEWLIAK